MLFCKDGRLFHNPTVIEHTMGMKKTNVARRSAFFLGACAALAKAVGMLYRIPMLNLMGAKGMGLFQLSFSLYALLCVTTGSGITVSVARASSLAFASGDSRQAEKITDTCLIFSLILSLILAVSFIIFSRPIAALLGNRAAAGSLVVLLCSLPFSAASACLRGYFQGKKKLGVYGVGQLVEQAGKLAVGLALAFVFADNGDEAASLCAAGGVVGAQLIVFCLFFVGYCRDRKSCVGINFREAKQTLSSAVSLTVGSISSPAFAIADGAITVRVLSALMGAQEATAQYGVLSGAVIALLHAPSVLIGALSVPMLPTLTVATKNGLAGETLGKYAKQVVFFSVVCGLCFLFFSPLCVRVLFPTGERAAWIARLLRLGCPIAALSCLSAFLTSALQGVGSVKALTLLSFASCLIKTVSLPFLLVGAGVFGAVAASVVGLAAFCLGSAIVLLSKLSVSFSARETFSLALSWAVFCCVALALRLGDSLSFGILSAILAFASSAVAFWLFPRFFCALRKVKADNQP